MSIPKFTIEEAGILVNEHFGITGLISQLPSYDDQNFHVQNDNGDEFVLKITKSSEKIESLELQNHLMEHLLALNKSNICPNPMACKNGDKIIPVRDSKDNQYFMRMLTFVPGKVMAKTSNCSPQLLEDMGRFMGQIDISFSDIPDSGLNKDFEWDLRNASNGIRTRLDCIGDDSKRTIIEYILRLHNSIVGPINSRLRQSMIHNDGNDYNILIEMDKDTNKTRVAGIIDFGDVIYSHTINELAICIAYAILEKDKPIESANAIINGYHKVYPLEEIELEVLFPLACLRLCQSVVMSADLSRKNPNNEYLIVNQKPIWAMLAKLTKLNPDMVHYSFRAACGFPAIKDMPASGMNFIPKIPVTAESESDDAKTKLLKDRFNILGSSLSISYKMPLKIIRGFGQYLYDENNIGYLDAVNNVPHVGHCHPHVVKAAHNQTALLNTNTRYLHNTIIDYARRLTATMPDPLSVCFFVCSGSEANELALRLAKNYTNGTELIVVDGAYHGNTSSLIDISPYKFDGPGGKGSPDYVHKVPMPDSYRGLYRGRLSDVGKKYASHITKAVEEIQKRDKKLFAFICESILGCAGQIILPDNYLKEAYKSVKNAGGLCIADEVQVGFGRVGSHFWAFETQRVVPDIVTLGKPMGNGYPLAAVVTTPEISASFDNGMEYFNTCGGNPVSCAIGMAVLDVIENESLQANSQIVGKYLKENLMLLKEKYPLIGDIRGMGLFIGIELVNDRENPNPASEEAKQIVNEMKEHRILVSTDGPDENIIKIKPPMVFSRANADFLVNTLDEILASYC